ncbi:restriction endonuclease subunit S [Achromobacter xylosoxidans]|uniref:restriction endonuclease subunit S n=1 Tax=Alcaligenes xylosoxydans xylosoxydans TaxID=85698 RepID=UPI0009710726|nr:restriction endonuclease subunit S [Achromobacter xylosoxidans]OMG91894.1 restriction endonuclease subunit S [Achromobacter xylosoxidans]
MSKRTAELLEEHFDTAFAAPDGVKKLRELILTLAMQGRLVPQDPSEPPASELLKEIEAEKQRLVDEGKIKKPRPLPSVTEEEKPYALPKGWEWARLGNIGLINPRNNADDDMSAGFVPMPLIQEGYSEFHAFEERPWGEIKKGYTHFADGDVGMAKITPCFENAKSCVFSNLPSGIGAGTTELHIFRNAFGAVAPRYLLFFLKNPKFISATAARMTGSAGQKRVPTPLFSEMELPLPPLSEQYRIVAKIDELMVRCDDLEGLRTAQQGTRLTAHAAAIKQLLNIAEPAQHQHAQAFLAEHFGELYTVKENVAELRKAILQLAVMGKLVPDAEPARLMPLESLLAEASINGVSKGPVDDSSKTEILRISAGTSRKDFYVDESDIKYVDLTENEIEKFKLQVDDLLACRFNGNLHYVGRFSLYKGASGRIQVNPDKLIRFRINTEKFLPRYICYAMNSKASRDVIESMCATTAGNIGLSAGRLKKVSIPIPSLAQQKKIVEKIDELIALCDSMDKKNDAAASKKTELLNALINRKSQSETEVQSHPAPLSVAQIIDLATYRASIGCYTLSKLANAQYFGRTAAAKVMYLAQAHIGLNLDLKPEREAAGPLDTWIYDFERQGQRKRWFEINEKTLASGRKKTEYLCLSALSEPAAKAEVLMTSGQKIEFDRLLYALADKKTEEVEIIATLFAVWNDFLIDGVRPTDAQIISEFRENWHERKARFTPTELGRWLDWLRTAGIVPRGLPPRTVHQSKLALH